MLVSKILSSPGANKPPPGTSLLCVGSIGEPWPGAPGLHHQRALARSPTLLLCCQQLEEHLVSDRQLCHTRVSFFGSKIHLPSFSVVLQQRQGKVESSST